MNCGIRSMWRVLIIIIFVLRFKWITSKNTQKSFHILRYGNIVYLCHTSTVYFLILKKYLLDWELILFSLARNEAGLSTPVLNGLRAVL